MNVKALTSRGRSRIAAPIGLLVTAGLLVACGSDDNEAAGSTVSVGAVISLTGPTAEVGTAFKEGIELAVDRVNSDGGIELNGEKKKLIVEFVDDESTPAGTQRAVQKLIDEDNTVFLGPALSTTFDTAYPILQDDEERLVLTPSAAAEKYLKAGGRLFKTMDSQGPEAMANFVKAVVERYQPKRVAVVQTQDPTGDIAMTGTVQGFEESGVEVVYQNQVAVDTQDYMPVVTAMQAADPDMVVTPYLDAVAGPLLSQAAQVGFVDPMFVNYGGSAAQLSDAPQISEFSYALTTRAVDNPEDPVTKDFRAAYKAKYDRDPKGINFYSLAFYDAVLVLAEAIEDAGTANEAQAIADAMSDVTEWDGRVLDLKFTGEGLARHTKQIVTITDGETTYSDY